MRKLLTLSLALWAISLSAQAQSSRAIASPERMQKQAHFQDDLRQIIDRPGNISSTAATNPGDPMGTVRTDAVTAIKVGEASNAFTFLIGPQEQLATAPTTGGGTVSFIYRHNISLCTGQEIDNGLLRYSLSTDGGNTWNVGDAGTSDASNTPAGSCYGVGPINPGYLQASRYPNALLSWPPGANQDINDLLFVYAAPVLGPTYPAPGATWDGEVAGVLSNINSNSPTIEQESYIYQGDGRGATTNNFLERVPGEYWYINRRFDYSVDPSPIINEIPLTKGVMDPATKQITWTNPVTLSAPFYTGFDGNIRYIQPMVAFAPDGVTGYAATLGDLTGGLDSVYSPIFWTTKDGGVNWSPAEEVDMRQFTGLSDSLQSFWINTTAAGDTVPAGSGIPTCGFDAELTVDANGNPHLVCIVGNASAFDGTSYGRPGYSISSGLRMFVYDFTKDEDGNWIMVYVGPQQTFRGCIGDPTGCTSGGSTGTSEDSWMQTSRSEDGNVVFFSYTDTDTAATGGNDNDAPDMIGRAFNVQSMSMTPVTNWTGDDANWASRALLPKMAPVALHDGNCAYTVPTVIMDIGAPGSSLINPVSFWYFSDVTYDTCADFTEPVNFLFDQCRETPVQTTLNITEPNCGQSDGSIDVQVISATGSTAFEWNTGAATSTVSGLSAGVYTVTVTDSLECTNTKSVTLNDNAAPALSIDSVSNITCNGFGNGSATVITTGGAGSETYLWSNGETTQTADSLSPGTNTVVVTDGAGCVAQTTVIIGQPTEVEVNLSTIAIDCFGNANGEVNASAFGGTGSISYLWNTTDTIADLTGLTAGFYEVIVTDQNGCTDTSNVTLDEPDQLASTTSVVDNGIANPPPFTGVLSVQASGGTQPFTYNWAIDSSFYNSFADMPGNQDSTRSFVSQVAPGTYVVTITDANGCVTTDTAVVGGPGPVSIDLAAGIENLSLQPNPTQGQFQLTLDLQRAQAIDVEVYNLQGQKLAAETGNAQLSHSFRFDLSAQPAGMYLIRVRTPQGSATRRIVLQ